MEEARIPADPVYLQAVGRTFYNFTYLEWVVVWTIAKLRPDGFGGVPKGETASRIAKALIKAIDQTQPSLPSGLRHSLVKFHEAYLRAIPRRNKLLHAHPFTATDGSQQLGGGGYQWPVEELRAAALEFQEAAIMGNDIFHGELAQVRP